jgi:hypothetical protein
MDNALIEGLENLLAGSGQPGLIELANLLKDLLAERDGPARLLDQSALGNRGKPVFRLRFAINGGTRSVVIKRLQPDVARRNELVVKRWLPSIGLNECGTPLLGSVVARNGSAVWHVYDDLGEHELDTHEPDRERVRAAVELVARLHTRFAGHPLLGEVRLHGGDRGIHFFEANVLDAIQALEAVRPAPTHRELRDSLLDRLYTLRDEQPARAAALASLDFPETLLHGDLWPINVFVIPTSGGLHARLIDWDQAAAGPLTYDLSTLLMRFPASHRPWILELYADAMASEGWRLPQPETLNLLLETHELARYANCVIWPAIAIGFDGGEWGFDALEEIQRWFATLAGDELVTCSGTLIPSSR